MSLRTSASGATSLNDARISSGICTGRAPFVVHEHPFSGADGQKLAVAKHCIAPQGRQAPDALHPGRNDKFVAQTRGAQVFDPVLPDDPHTPADRRASKLQPREAACAVAAASIQRMYSRLLTCPSRSMDDSPTTTGMLKTDSCILLFPEAFPQICTLSPENRPDYGLTEGPCREETTQQMRTGRLPAFKNRSDSCLPAPCISIQRPCSLNGSMPSVTAAPPPSRLESSHSADTAAHDGRVSLSAPHIHDNTST